MNDDDTRFVQELTGKVSELVRYSQAAERVRSILVITHLVAVELQALRDMDSDLGPELLACGEHLQQAGEALTRAHNFASTRLSVRMEAT